MRKTLPALFVFVSLACAHPPAGAPASDASHAARIERHLVAPKYARPVPPGHDSLSERMAYWHVPGVSIAVINQGKVEWARGYGQADPVAGTPVDGHTLFHGASLSKPVNAMIVLKLVQDGKLDLDKDVNDQLKSWKLPPSDFAKGYTITLRRLLSHTAGMSWAAFGRGYPATQPAASLVQLLEGKPPATQPVRVEETPGKRFHYSGGAVMVSQLMVEEATGEPYPAFARKVVFDPLGMGESTFEQALNAEQLKRAAPGLKNGERVNGPERVYPAMSAAGLWSTPADYCRVVMEIQRAAAGAASKVISPGAAEVMLTPYVANAKNANPRPSTVGLGVFLAGTRGGRTFFHAGSHAGYSCYMIGRVEAGQGAVVMTNGDDAFDLIAEIVQTIGEEYGWADYQFVPPPRAKPATTAPTRPVN